MLSRFAFAQEDDSDRRHEYKNADDLKRQIVFAEKQRADISNIVDCRSCERRKSLPGRLKVADHKKNLNEQGERDCDSSCRRQPVDSARLLGAKIKKHDDEKKQHHHRARINQHLNNAYEVGVERHEESGEAEKGNDEIKRARYGIASNDDTRAEYQHQQGKSPK